MPFDLEQNEPVFQKLDDGGLQKVVAKDASNKKQIALIQTHLKAESEKFRKGDFSDPAKIHGEDMPGLAGVKNRGHEKSTFAIRLCRMGRRFDTQRRIGRLVMALHQWFSAQLSDHGTSRYTSLRRNRIRKCYSDLLFKDGLTERRKNASAMTTRMPGFQVLAADIF